MSKKNKNSKIIAGIISSAVLISGATTGILYNSEMEENIEEEIEIEKKKNLEIIFLKGKRNLGKIYIGQDITTINDDEKVKKEIIDIFSNKYNIDVTSLEIKIVTNQNEAIITSINEDIYIGTVKLKYSPNRSFVTLDYIVPDLNIRDKQVPTYSYQHHQEILFGKNDILNDKEFKNLPAVNDFINILNEQVKFKASEESNNAFKKLENNNDNFKDFEDLKKQFNDHYLLFDGKIDFESFIKTISNYHINANIDELKTGICRFYNILAQLYGKNNVFKMLEKIELDQKLWEQSKNKYVRRSTFWFL
ncbi:hypothetical protein [Spiroplasma endosymbiont of Colias croceus]|uniref:hypothetical protein n=1 Tax=Spiroplasma endosymbiont of Colias croceus TaxID=3066310 RepID=UPI0030D5DFB9